MQHRENYGETITLWSVQESLLQTYRTIFITVQSIVFAIAATIATNAPWPALILTALGLGLLCIWRLVTSNRALDVSFLQWLVVELERGASNPAPLTILKEFQAGHVVTIGAKSVWRFKGKDPEGKVNDVPFVKLGDSPKSPTRQWMEGWLRLFFLVLWIVVATLAVSSMHSAARERHMAKSTAEYIPDGETAIKIAVAVWSPIYGKDKIASEKPYKTILKDNVWYVSGSLPKGWIKGGVAEAEINKNDGCIIRISHGK